jgi:hypothetical protein
MIRFTKNPPKDFNYEEGYKELRQEIRLIYTLGKRKVFYSKDCSYSFGKYKQAEWLFAYLKRLEAGIEL